MNYHPLKNITLWNISQSAVNYQPMKSITLLKTNTLCWKVKYSLIKNVICLVDSLRVADTVYWIEINWNQSMQESVYAAYYYYLYFYQLNYNFKQVLTSKQKSLKHCMQYSNDNCSCNILSRITLSFHRLPANLATSLLYKRNTIRQSKEIKMKWNETEKNDFVP